MVRLLRTIFDRTTTFSICRQLSTSSQFKLINNDCFPIDHQYFQIEQNQKNILENIRLRQIEDDYPQLFNGNTDSDQLAKLLIDVSQNLPNDLHPSWIDSDNSLKVIDIVNDDRKYDFSPIRAETLLFNKKLVYFSDLKYGKLGLVAGRRSYAYLGKLAKLARVLTNWTLRKLLNEYNFTPVVIPNLLHSDIIRACGFNPDGQRTQVYALENPPSPCLAGTAEMSLASLHIGENFSTEQELPKRYCALSRCYRAEAKSSGEMSGLYRVNYFDKVEMFGITEADGQHSDKMLEEFVSIQKALFTELGLHFRVVDMPPMDLGKPAYRKFDIESYMAGRDFWGEISSASNCTDYQSKRLNITYNKFYFDSKTEEIVDVKRCFVHTVNGTACAVPRMIISIVEQNQTNDGQVLIPKVLRPYMNGEKVL